MMICATLWIKLPDVRILIKMIYRHDKNTLPGIG